MLYIKATRVILMTREEKGKRLALEVKHMRAMNGKECTQRGEVHELRATIRTSMNTRIIRVEWDNYTLHIGSVLNSSII